MKIVVDLRSLSSGSVSGVENYCHNVVHSLLEMDRKNAYTLFFNSLKLKPNLEFNYVNSKLVVKHYPNKLLNLGFKLGWFNFEKLVGEFDWLFLPNPNQFNLNIKNKLALTIHDLSPFITPEFYDLKRKLWHKFLNFENAVNRANVIFAVSETTKNDIVRLFNVNPNKVVVAYPGIDKKNFKPNVDQALQRNARNIYDLPGKYLLFLNTIEPRKNLSGLIKAFELLEEPIPLVIAGRLGWKYSKDLDILKKSKKKHLIKYIGYVKEEYKPAIIKMATALVYPSFYEGFGFQPLEAAACGTPSVVSQVASLPEVMADSALLVNPYSVSDLAGALKEISSNVSLREALIEKAKLRVEKFSWELTSQTILKALENR